MSKGIFEIVSSTAGLDLTQESNELRNDKALKWLLENYDGHCEIEENLLTKQYIIRIKSKILLIDEWYVIEECKKIKYLKMLLQSKKRLEKS